MITQWQNELMDAAQPERKEIFQRLFKTGKGEYGEGDIFIGLTVPANRSISKKYFDRPLDEISAMLASPVHEHRLGALLAIVEKYKKAKSDSDRKAVADFYISICRLANNWDLVDLSAPYILGRELAAGKHHDTVRRLAASESLWERRTAVVATLTCVRHAQLDLALEMCLKTLEDPEPLMRKATGWVLREAGKKDITALRRFLSDNIGRISSTTLSYATEKFTPAERAELRNMRNLRKNS